MGIPDRRIHGLEMQWNDLLCDADRLMVGAPDGIPVRTLDRAARLWPRVRELLEEADSPGLPHTVVHEDLHDGNIFCAGDRIILADWGDSSLANPLTTLTVLLRSAAYRRGLTPSAPEVTAIRNWYLHCWREFANDGRLHRAAAAAERIGMLHRALTWRASIMSAPAETTTEWADAVPGWLAEFVTTFD